MKSFTSNSQAKFYIYRNLHKNCFSVKFKGIVIAHCDNFIAQNAFCKVNEKTRLSVVANKRKSVHAYIVADSLQINVDCIVAMSNRQLKYNPYKGNSFTLSNESVNNKVFTSIKGFQGKVYAPIFID